MELNRIQRIRKAPQDRDLWQKLYYKYQKSYQRRRLEAIKMLWDGLKITDVRFRLGCAVNTLNNWIDSYLSGGFHELLKSKQSGKTGTGQLTGNRLRVFKYIILHKTPDDYSDYDLVGYVWTLGKMEIFLSKKWDIELKTTRIHEILDKELNLSFQKHHRDYANASSIKQQDFVADMNNVLIIRKKKMCIFGMTSLVSQLVHKLPMVGRKKIVHQQFHLMKKKENDITPC